MKNKYTDEVNIQILISLLKAHKINKVIASPGTSNISIVGSMQNDDFFEIYSCVDERSAAYMACGLAAELDEAVVLVCTGATASRNYIPGLTEAFYRKLPIIAITASQHFGKIGQNVPQVLDRFAHQNDILKLSVHVPSVYSDEDKWACNLNINKAILESTRNGGGPVLINIVSTYSSNFNIDKLPKPRVINRVEYYDKFPEIDNKKSIAIFIGSHQKFDNNLINSIELFCEKYNAVVLCDHTSNYTGKYKIQANIICDQSQYRSPLKDMDILIDIGNVSGAYLNLNPKEVWRINLDGEIRDTLQKLTYVFQMRELDFFNKYNLINDKKSSMSYYHSWRNEKNDITSRIDDNNLPFSNIWIAKKMIELLPNNSIIHLGILNSLRAWNFFDNDKVIYGYSNTGGFGIDGLLSTLIGASLANKDRNIYGVIGDLAFFYDMNSLGNRNIGNNIRLLVINNGGGMEFHNYNNRGFEKFGDSVGKYIAADGHFGNKSKELLKNYAKSLGFYYLSADNKDEFLEKVNNFLNEKSDKSIIFEVFTNSIEEREALKIIHNVKKNNMGVIKNIMKKTLGVEKFNHLKKIIRK